MDAKLKETILNPIFKGNPITVLVLGICSSLAVTVTMKGALVMALSVIVVTGISSLILSLLRNTIPGRVRIIVQLVVVAMMVILVDQILKAGEGTYRHENMTSKLCPRCGKHLLAVNGKTSRMLVCQDRECGYRETVARITNARCPNCHKKMELVMKGKEETFVCACGYKERLSAFTARREKEGAGRR